jgi:predicted metal-dependent phosphoesterase TrpH
MFRVDLHTHSVASPDGGLTIANYAAMLKSGRLQAVAVTDHDRIDFALDLQTRLGDAVIVGEEVTAREGEIIGLYLVRAVPAGLSAQETAHEIHKQGGLVYVPHPFETTRKGLPLAALETIAGMVDIVETYNGRSLQNRSGEAQKWAAAHDIPQISSSDAHGRRGWGNTASMLAEPPTRETLLRLLLNATADNTSTGGVGRLYPKLNRLKQRVTRA